MVPKANPVLFLLAQPLSALSCALGSEQKMKPTSGGGVPEKKDSLTVLPLTLFGLGNKVCENDTTGFLGLFSLKILHILYAPSADEGCLWESMLRCSEAAEAHLSSTVLLKKRVRSPC